jgi:hypothetical protein
MLMKKILITLSILLLIFIACVYIFIPSKLQVSALVKIAAPVSGVYRCASTENMWNKWANAATDSLHKKITIANSFIHEINVLIYNDNDSITTTMNFLPLSGDSMIVQWKFSMAAANNPFERISKYSEAVQLKKKMDDVLQQLKLFASKTENIYGFGVHETSTKDTILITAKTNLTQYPSTNDIYNLVDKLENYAVRSDAQITGYPMYNVTKTEGDTMRLMVAIPVNKELEQSASVSTVRMVPGRFLVAQITGGEETVKNALNQMHLYFAEHNRTAMAIPFSYLITNRKQEPDTAKWITKIYAPVF